MLLDPDDPFFAAPWRRVALVVFALGWAIFEFATGSAFWGVLFGAIGIYAGWVLLVKPRIGN